MKYPKLHNSCRRTGGHYTIEEKLRDDRRKIYLQILDPYIRLFSDTSDKGKLNAIKKVTSYEYKKTAFELNLFGSDDVVKSYNKLLMHMFEVDETGDQKPNVLWPLWGEFLIEVRRSLGNKNTKLKELDMLRGMIKGIDKFIE